MANPLLGIIDAIFAPSPLGFFLAVLAIFTVPILLHSFVFRPRGSQTLPTFLLLGPSSSGKTTLLTAFASPTPSETRVSQAPLSLEASIPATLTASSKFRSSNDPSLRGTQKFILQDTPGHGKLRPRAAEMLTKDTRGVVFVVDASTTDWSDAAEYLYTVLLRIQKLQESSSAGKGARTFNVLIACNKSDLFTALPAQRVRKLLEHELGRIREAKARGIVGVGEEDREDEDWLGEGGSGDFTFESLEEVGCVVDFRLGSNRGDDGWRKQLNEWIGSCL